MVSHQLAPGIEITVLVNGQPLTEYDCENDKTQHEDPAVVLHQSQRTATKYIESTTGQQFTIQLKVDKSCKLDSPNLCFNVYVDGKLIVARLLAKEILTKRRRPWVNLVTGPSSGEGQHMVRRSMEFTDIITTDDEVAMSVACQLAKVARTGEIKVEVHRQSGERPNNRGPKKFPEGDLPGLDYMEGINEKALKGSSKSHGMKLGAAVPVLPPKKRSTIYIDDKELPRLVAIFKYRSDKALKSLGVKEATPETEEGIAPNTTESDDHGVNVSGQFSDDQKIRILEEFRNQMDSEFQRFLAQRSANSTSIKQEDTRCTGRIAVVKHECTSNSSGGVSRKRENQTTEDANLRPRKRPVKPKTKTIIELLDSDDEERNVIELE